MAAGHASYTAVRDLVARNANRTAISISTAPEKGRDRSRHGDLEITRNHTLNELSNVTYNWSIVTISVQFVVASDINFLR